MIAPLLADKKAADLLQDEEFLWLVGILVVTLLIAAMIFSWLGRWRKRQLTDVSAADIDQFGNYRAMFERGELSQEEYDRIRLKEARRLSDRMTLKTGNPPPAAKERPAQPSPKEPESPPPQP